MIGAASSSGPRGPQAGQPGAAATPGNGTLTIVPVEGRRHLAEFIGVPWTVHEGDPLWVPPLRVERRHHLSRKNPFFEHAEARYWIARKGGRAVGRISAQVDTLHEERYRDGAGFFGMLEAVDDPDVFAALFGAAESWLREKGRTRAVGPFNLSINEECGLLVEGFDTPPMVLMSHDPPWADERVRACGYRKAKDLIAYLLDTTTTPPRVMERALRKAADRGLGTRPLRFDRLDDDLALIRDIFNDAWSDNWFFVPFTDAELGAFASLLKTFVPAEFVQIASVGDRPAAMLVLLPNLNETIADLDGRLLPFGWARLLWRLRRRFPASARVVLMGVRHELQRTAVGMALVFLMIEALRRPVAERGVRQVELSWILEDNLPMRHVIELGGARDYKRYRMYEKSLG